MAFTYVCELRWLVYNLHQRPLRTIVWYREAAPTGFSLDSTCRDRLRRDVSNRSPEGARLWDSSTSGFCEAERMTYR